MKSPLIFVIIFILTSVASCRKIGREVIGLKNNYTDTIFTIVAWAGMDHVYPDTTLPIKQPGMRYVPPGEKGVISREWEAIGPVSFQTYLPILYQFIYLIVKHYPVMIGKKYVT